MALVPVERAASASPPPHFASSTEPAAAAAAAPASPSPTVAPASPSPEFIETGGGLPWEYRKTQDTQSLEDFCANGPLYFMADEQLECRMDDVSSVTVQNMPRVITAAGGCSGSGMDHIVLDSIGEALQRHNIDVEFKHLFHCEIDATKQKWLMSRPPVDESGSEQDLCVFEDISNLVGKCTCACHGPARAVTIVGSDGKKKKVNGTCAVVRADMFMFGSSCKYFSRLSNSQRKDGRPASVLQRLSKNGLDNEDNSSFKTWKGAYEYIREYKPYLLLWENTDTVMDADPDIPADSSTPSSGLEFVCDSVEELGYRAFAFLANAKDYGLPQSRSRIYMIAVRSRDCPWHKMRSESEWSKFWSTLALEMERAKRKPVADAQRFAFACPERSPCPFDVECNVLCPR